jgi:hypothetical protein
MGSNMMRMIAADRHLSSNLRSRHDKGGCVMRRAMTVLALSSPARFPLNPFPKRSFNGTRGTSGGAHRSGFQCGVLPTAEVVNQRGQHPTGDHDRVNSAQWEYSRPPPIRSSFWKSRSRCRCISLPRS